MNVVLTVTDVFIPIFYLFVVMVKMLKHATFFGAS